MKKNVSRREFLRVMDQGIAVTGLVTVSNVAAIATEPLKNEINAEWITSLVKDYVATSSNNSVGKAIRCGSIIARIKVPPTPRPYKDHHACCLYYAKGTCGMCISGCPSGAVTKSGHDKHRCANQCMSTWEYATKELELPPKVYGCGFCQTGVPCESKIPVKI